MLHHCSSSYVFEEEVYTSLTQVCTLKHIEYLLTRCSKDETVPLRIYTLPVDTGLAPLQPHCSPTAAPLQRTLGSDHPNMFAACSICSCHFLSAFFSVPRSIFCPSHVILFSSRVLFVCCFITDFCALWLVERHLGLLSRSSSRSCKRLLKVSIIMLSPIVMITRPGFVTDTLSRCNYTLSVTTPSLTQGLLSRRSTGRSSRTRRVPSCWMCVRSRTSHASQISGGFSLR